MNHIGQTKKILFMVTQGNWGGAQKYIFDLSTNLGPDYLPIVASGTESQILPEKLKEDIKSHVEGIFELVRNQRNDSGHPTGKDVSKDDLFINLRLFITFCQDIYKLIEWLDANPLWEGDVQARQN